MKPRSIFVAGTITIALACFAQQPGQGKLVKALDGSFAIYYNIVANMSIGVEFTVNGDSAFNASGTRLNGFSKEQNLTFSMNAISGVAALDVDQPKRLKHAVASGKVVMDVETETEGGTMVSHLETEQVEMQDNETEAVFKITKPFLFTNKSTTANGDRLFELRAPSGVFTLPPLGAKTEATNPFKSADVPGPVKIKVVSHETGGDEVMETIINVRADKMTYSAKDRVLRLSGNVLWDYVKRPVGSDEAGIELESDQVMIFFDEDSLVTNVKSLIGVLRTKDGGGE